MIASHQSAKILNDEWLTPPEILKDLGEFDLDPCSPIKRPWDTAKKHYSIEDNGLLQNWEGRVWLNPPYGNELGYWLDKMALHNNGVVLIFARTETSHWFNYIWDHASGILFIKGRLFFHDIEGVRAKANSGAPSVLLAYGKENAEILKASKIKGKFLYLNH